MESLKNKAVIITGASSGIGRATAIRLAGHGAQVALSGRNRDALNEVQRLIGVAGGIAHIAPADVTNADEVCSAIDDTVARSGKLDILIASAGLSMRTYFE